MRIRIIVKKVLDAFFIYIAMYMSGVLINNAMVGGALYLLGLIWLIYLRLFSRRASIPRFMAKQGVFILISTVLLNIAILFVYPAVAKNRLSIVLLGMILYMVVWQSATDLIAIKSTSRRCRLWIILAHICFSAAAAGLIALFDISGGGNLLVLTRLGNAIRGLIQCVEASDDSAAESMKGLDGLMDISACRTYNYMLKNLMIALNIGIICYICYMNLQPGGNPMADFLYLLLWLAGLGFMILLLWLFLSRRMGSKYDKPSVFIVGALLWCLASVGYYNGWFAPNAILYILWCAGLGCMLCVLVSLGQDMQTVVAFTMDESESVAYRRNTYIMIEWSILLSYLLLVVMMTVSAFAIQGKIDDVEAMIGVKGIFNLAFLLLPVVFVIIAMIYAMLQPLDKQYTARLKKYREETLGGVEKPEVRNHLLYKLNKTTKRVGIRLLCLILRPFLPCKVKNADIVNLKNGPVVFVCNHLEILGPMLTVLYMPFYFRPWITHEILDMDSVKEQLRDGVDRVFKFLPASWRKVILSAVCRPVVYVTNSLDPIPVYRGGIKDVLMTIRMSVDALKEEDNLLLFPENPSKAFGEGEKYPTEGAAEFFTGFAQIGVDYYRATGRCTTFYPLYINKKLRTMTFFDGVTYDCKNQKSAEKQRIAKHLHDSMVQEPGNKPPFSACP